MILNASIGKQKTTDAMNVMLTEYYQNVTNCLSRWHWCD